MENFIPFPKIPRLMRNMIITEKIDGTNASIWIGNLALVNEPIDPNECHHVIYDGIKYLFRVGSRKRFITPNQDNYGFARWAYERADELVKELGEGVHFGEWWGQGIQRRYDMDEKVFSLFNTTRWEGEELKHCSVVPILSEWMFDQGEIDRVFGELSDTGSCASPGYMNPEGIMVFHTAANQMFKMTFEGDEKGKGI